MMAELQAGVDGRHTSGDVRHRHQAGVCYPDDLHSIDPLHVGDRRQDGFHKPRGLAIELDVLDAVRSTDLLVLRAYEDVRLLSSRQFLEWLDGSEKAKSADDAEMAEILGDDALVRRLRTGSEQARRRKGHFVD